MKIIAFSGPPNTGKSTAIFGDKEKGIKGASEMLTELGYKVKVYPEIARQFFGLLPCKDNGLEDTTFFQQAIHIAECTRLKELRKDYKHAEYDFILVDRTWYDAEIFYEWNMDHKNHQEFKKQWHHEDKALYKEVILFTDPIVVEGEKRYLYDSQEFTDFFLKFARIRYEDRIEFKNSIDFLPLCTQVLLD